MPFPNRLYAAAARAAASLLGVAAPLDAKLARGVAARRGALAHLQGWAQAHRDQQRPLIWLHAPSVGEALMAEAMAGSLRAAFPDLQLALTIFSPSAERVLGRAPVDVAGYLPWDTAHDAAATVRALRPAAVGFVRTEVWPLMLDAALATGARAALVNAVLAPSSSRLRWPARALLRPLYARLDAVGVVAEAHAARFRELGVDPQRIRVTGDARFDQVLRRTAAIDRTAPLLAGLTAGALPLLVAGSTWAADEQVLAEGLAPMLHAHRLRLIIAPHEPTPSHLDALDEALARAGIRAVRLATIERAGFRTESPAVIVDRVGVLADLYAIAACAYVGGGFGAAGLHSVAEPAALGVPTLFGPRSGNALEAHELAAAGGGIVIEAAQSLRAAVAAWLDDPVRRAAAGNAARTFARARAGGADGNARLLAQLAGLAPAPPARA